MFLLSVYTSKKFYTSYTHVYIYIHCDILIIHLKITEVWLKCRVLPFIFIVKSLQVTETIHNKHWKKKQLWDMWNVCKYSNSPLFHTRAQLYKGQIMLSNG